MIRVIPKRNKRVNSWQPIESAPKDRRIDLWAKRGYREPGASWANAVQRHGGPQTGWHTLDGSIRPSSDFSHWRDMPAPPRGRLPRPTIPGVV